MSDDGIAESCLPKPEDEGLGHPAPPDSRAVRVGQPPLARHDSRTLDLAFAMDTTGSMSSYISSARDNIRGIVEEIVAKEASDVRLALVEYRDHPPQEETFVTRVHDFSARVADMRQWLEESSAVGGGDTPEAVADALHQVLKLSWRPEATKICVLISDAPPHGLHPAGDSFPDGCPEGLDPMDIARKLAEKAVTLYVAGCEPSLAPYKDFFAALAYVTGGQYVPLSAASALTPVIIGGAQEELSLEQWMEQVNARVLQEVEQRGQDNVDVECLSRHVMADLKLKGATSRHLKFNKASLAAPSSYVTTLSECRDMGSVRSRFKASEVVRPAPMSFGCLSTGGSSMPPPPPPPHFKSACLASAKRDAHEAEAVYDTTEEEVNIAQAQRMVQKSLMRNQLYSKKE